MRFIRLRTWLLASTSAMLQIFMFPMAGPLPLWRACLGWVALVPFLLALTDVSRNGTRLTIKQAATLGYMCGVLWYLGNCYWIYQTMYLYGGLAKPVALGILILFALYLGIYHALFAILFSLIRNSKLGSGTALAMAPALWVAVELARGRITGFPWDLLGMSQVDNLLLTRLAPLAGVMAISFVLVSLNALFTAAIRYNAAAWRVLGLAGIVVAAILQSAPGACCTDFSPRHVAVLLQENLAVGAAGRDVVPLSPQEELEQFPAMSLHPNAVAGVTGKPELIVWPEAPSHLHSNDPYFQMKLGELARTSGAVVVAGSLGVDINPASPRGAFVYDSATLFNPDGAYAGRYDKIHLVPWGEYVPFKRFFSFAEKLTEGVGDMDPGHDRAVFRGNDHLLGVFICYESIFGDEIRQFANNGAQVLINISDDGWYGDTGAPWQHLNMARMRAIENHRWLLRATNTGITTSIDPLGRVQAGAPRHVRGAYAFTFDYIEPTTFYTRTGDWFAYLCALLTVLLVASTFYKPQPNELKWRYVK